MGVLDEGLRGRLREGHDRRMSRLITQSLVGSVDWYTNCPPDWREKARADLVNQLSRASFEGEPPTVIRRGYLFEDAVRDHVIRESVKASEHFLWFLEQCRGAVFQKKVKRYVEIDGVEYCLYGRIDAWFVNVIKDIKTTGRYGGRDKYLNSFQHKLYCYIERIPSFVYLIAEFDGPQSMGPVIAHYAVDYQAPPLEELEREVITKVKEVVDFLKSDEELYTLYTTSFSRY